MKDRIKQTVHKPVLPSALMVENLGRLVYYIQGEQAPGNKNLLTASSRYMCFLPGSSLTAR